MDQIPVFRTHAGRIEKDRFMSIGRHLGIRGEFAATAEALFLHDKERALAYAMPGSRFAGLLFFTDQSQGMAAHVERAPGSDRVEAWSADFLKRFQLGLRESNDKKIQVSLSIRALRTDSVIEEGQENPKVRRVPAKTEVASALSINNLHVTGPRAKVRMVFKNARTPMWIHRALWDKIEVFEMRSLVTEDEAHRRISDRISARGDSARPWRLNEMRLAYFAGECCGGPDLLEPYYFAEVEFRDPKDQGQSRQGPRQLIQIPAGR
jgi:hypothetical protein